MALAGVIVVLLGFAAWRDFTTRTIPDLVSIGIMLAGIAVRLPDGWAAAGTSAACALVLFALLVPLNSCGLLGGGDLKLLAALAFGLSPLESYQMVSAVVLAGGVLALFYVLVGRILLYRRARRPSRLRPRSTAHRVAAVELWRIRKGAPLPYGLAIAAGASIVIGLQGA